MNCQQCGALLPIEPGRGHRLREYCNRACRQKHYREQVEQRLTQHQADQDAALSAELAALRAQVATLEQENAEQASQITTLRDRLDFERRYLEDTTPRYFKSWLKKQPSSPWRDRFLSDQLVPARGPRSLYEAHVRRLHLDEEEHDDFVRLWKLMLLQA